METYHGFVRTPADAIKLFEACRLGLLPRVQRRLSEKERQSIRSGSVFVWDEREAGMRRWTDGKSWSASRVSGSFLTYREMEGKRGGGFVNGPRRIANKTPDSGRGSDEDHEDGEPDGYRYKADGLMKQSFSITTSTGQHLHLISYYSRPQPGQADLPQPTNDPSLRHIVPVKGMYPESSMGETNQTPALTRAPMQQPPYMVPHHAGHQQPYPPAYGQHGYGWPPSPAVTPPYSHYTTAPYPPAPHHQHPHAGTQHMPPYASAQHPYEAPRVALPPPLPQKASYPYPPSQYRAPSPPRLNDPRDQDLRAAAQAVMVDPRISPGARNPGGPLPALSSITSGAAPPSMLAEAPPARHSVTPPRSSHSEVPAASSQARGSLSSLLHPTAESNHSGGSGSAHGSPQTTGLSLGEKTGSEDSRALRMLDRSAFRVAGQVVA